jgi:AhpC/TSA antioxidant enzyme
MPCRAHLGEVQVRHEEFRRLGAGVLVITQARPELLALFLQDNPLPFPISFNPSRQAYQAFGLGRTTWTGMLQPRVVLRFLKLLFRGWLPSRPTGEEDVLQLGGDFILDGQGRLVYAYRSSEPTDRPPVDELLQVIRTILQDAEHATG